MAQNKKRSDAVWDIIAGTIMAIVGIVVMKTVRMHFNPEGEWPEMLLYGSVFVGGCFVYKGINALKKNW